MLVKLFHFNSMHDKQKQKSIDNDKMSIYVFDEQLKNINT